MVVLYYPHRQLLVEPLARYRSHLNTTETCVELIDSVCEGNLDVILSLT